MQGRKHFAAPVLLAIVVALIVYVSLYPFRFDSDGPSILEAMRQLSWARASRSDMLNNILLYVPFGFCAVLLVEPRLGRTAAVATGLFAGLAVSFGMEVTQASIATRVPSLTDLTLNGAGALAGALGGSLWHALDRRMTPLDNPEGRSGAIAITILALWLITRLWPFVPDASLRQLKRAVRPLFTPQIEWTALLAFFVGWLVVAQAVFHLARRQRSVDTFLVVIMAVLVGRTLTSGNSLEPAELAAIALLLPVLVLISRVPDRGRSALLAAALGTWLVSIALLPALGGQGSAPVSVPGLREILDRPALPPVELAGRAFGYLAFTWLLAGAGLLPHVAAGVTIVLVLLLGLTQAGLASPAYGWSDLAIAVVAGLVVTRWMPRDPANPRRKRGS